MLKCFNGSKNQRVKRLCSKVGAAVDKHLYEVDFLLSCGSKICPIEVKSSGYKTHASLDAFCTKYSSRVGERYLIYTKDLRKDGNVWLLPIYMAGLL